MNFNNEIFLLQNLKEHYQRDIQKLQKRIINIENEIICKRKHIAKYYEDKINAVLHYKSIIVLTFTNDSILLNKDNCITITSSYPGFGFYAPAKFEFYSTDKYLISGTYYDYTCIDELHNISTRLINAIINNDKIFIFPRD